ncbi:MAG: Gfo/Idh/MocA family oxidoreductase [Actinomycetia bacterium]|nr:Gfo/Idh/MocA family oxidoreductase [Actinomycetes bacterium]
MRVSDGQELAEVGLCVGVAGCGYWGSNHLRVLQSVPGVREVMAIDQDSRILAETVERHPFINTSGSVEEALEQVDALIIATPPSSHASLAVAALEAGVHVMPEKPLATSVAEARQVVELADSTGLVLMCGHTFEYNSAVWRLRDLIQSGELGQIYHVDAARLNLGLYRDDVNVIWDLAPHDISIVNYLFDSQPTTIRAWATPHAHQDLEDLACLQLHYSDIDVSAQIHVSWLDPHKVRRVTVIGSEKMAVFNDMAVDERIRVYDKGVAFGVNNDGTAAYRHGGIESPFIAFEEPLMVEDRQFVRSIITGETPPSDGRSGLAVVKALAAAEQSLRLGRPVDLVDTALKVAVA